VKVTSGCVRGATVPDPPESAKGHVVRQTAVGIFIAGAAVAFAQDAKVPIEFQGRWQPVRRNCDVAHEASLTVYENRIEFYESRRKVLSVGTTRLLEVDLELEATAEGQTSREVRRFVLSNDQRTLTDVTNSRYKLSRVRCD
jgi:hypothetical protein